MKILRLFNDGLEKIEAVLASLALLFMIALAFLQVVLRNVWDTGIIWGDPVVRMLVLWVGFLGASIATHQRSHIRFDVVSKFLPPKPKIISELVVHLASSYVCYLLFQAAREFVMMEKEFQTPLVEGFPTWIALLIIPVSFLIMSFRLLVLGVQDAASLAKPPKEDAP